MKKFSRALKYVWLLIIIGFVSWFLIKRQTMVIDTVQSFSVSTLFLSFGAIFIAKFILAFFTYLCLNYIDKQISFKECFYIYQISQLAKYLPGNIWHFVAKGVYYKKKGLSLNQTNKVILIENFWIVFSALIIGSALLVLNEKAFLYILFQKYKIYIFAYAVLLTGITGFAIWIANWKKSLDFFLKKWELHLKIFSVLILAWFFIGSNFYLVYISCVQGSTSFSYVTGVFIIAFCFGFVTPFAPAGVGIRETVLVLGLASHASYETVLIASGMTRIIYIFVELLLAFVLFSAPQHNKL
jgi:Lysylphosphatidylglycerol synthase TM region